MSVQAVFLRPDRLGCAGQVGNPLLPGIKSKMLPDTDFTHQQYYEAGHTRPCLPNSIPCTLFSRLTCPFM